MNDIERYENFIYKTECEIQYEKYQIRIRGNRICRILNKLSFISNREKKQKLLRILSKLFANQ